VSEGRPTEKVRPIPEGRALLRPTSKKTVQGEEKGMCSSSGWPARAQHRAHLWMPHCAWKRRIWDEPTGTCQSCWDGWIGEPAVSQHHTNAVFMNSQELWL
jgi:hypothetical protein